MPQMAPMPWVSLFFTFLVVLFVVFSLVYFSPKVEKSGIASVGLKEESYMWPW